MSKLAKALTAAAGNAGGGALYAEDVFSTYVRTGTGDSPTITNGIDLSGEGGLVWVKSRSQAYDHNLFDTERGASKKLVTNSTDAEGTISGVTAFNSDGFTLGDSPNVDWPNFTYAYWTFRKAEKFFDVVTFSTVGDGTAQSFSHNLGSVPAVMIVKKTSSTRDWFVYHKDLNGGINPEQYYLQLNGTNAQASSSIMWANTAPTSTQFTLGGVFTNSGNEGDFVAYLFASDAGGFGDDGSESIIKCGSYTGNGSAGLEVDLGFEPQFVLIKRATGGTGNWMLEDVMRGMSHSSAAYLYANLSAEEQVSASNPTISATSTGFSINSTSVSYNVSSSDYIYIAIRRPMKTPESGTEVFNVEIGNGGGSSTVPEFSAPFASDLFYMQNRNGGGANYNGSRLAGNSYLLFESTAAEASGLLRWDAMNGMYFYSTTDYTGYMFKRATGFFDVVAYTGDGVNGRDVIHNLKVLPEFVIIKERNSSTYWLCWHKDINDYYLRLNDTNAAAAPSTFWDHSTYPVTSTSFPIGTHGFINGSGDSYIAYLFATVAGVSKVGSYTGTGSNVDVDCGFSAGARFILIKRTDSTGDWYVWDSERGIVAGNDPYLLLNSTAAEVTSTDYIDPLSSGFTVTSSAPAALNASGGSYIFMAIS